MGQNKQDRLARLLRVEHLLYQSKYGLTVKEIAEECEVCTKTTRRDIAALEESSVPIWYDKTRIRVMEGDHLPPIHFTLPEAMTIFLAARLLLAYSNTYNPNIYSSFVKLNSIVRPPLRDQIALTIAWMQKLNRDDKFLKVLEILSQSWMQRRRARIWYKALGRTKDKDRIIEPYFIQPAALERGNYAIAYCHSTKQVRTFKVERITSIQLREDTYSIPKDFDANKYFGTAWGIAVYGKPENIKLRFDKEVGRIAQETRWHPSQVTEMQPDGSALVTFKLSITAEFINFIMWWGEKVEVLQPASLRKDVAGIAKNILDFYNKKGED